MNQKLQQALAKYYRAKERYEVCVAMFMLCDEQKTVPYMVDDYVEFNGWDVVFKNTRTIESYLYYQNGLMWQALREAEQNGLREEAECFIDETMQFQLKSLHDATEEFIQERIDKYKARLDDCLLEKGT